jgi:hypothetical protein
MPIGLLLVVWFRAQYRRSPTLLNRARSWHGAREGLLRPAVDPTLSQILGAELPSTKPFLAYTIRAPSEDHDGLPSI